MTHDEIGECLRLYLELEEVSWEQLAEDEGVDAAWLERKCRAWDPTDDDSEERGKALKGAVKAVLRGQGVVAASRAWCVGVVPLRRELAKHPEWTATRKPSTARAPKGGGIAGEVEAWICAQPGPVGVNEVIAAFPAKGCWAEAQHRRKLHNCLKALREQGRIAMIAGRSAALYTAPRGGGLAHDAR